MKILISSLCPFIISGYSNQIKLLITYLHKFNPDIEIGIICWNNWPIPFKTISLKCTSITIIMELLKKLDMLHLEGTNYVNYIKGLEKVIK